MMPTIASKTESFSTRISFRQSERGLPPRARALHGLGQLIRKSAPCAVRTDRRNGGHAIGHRRAAASCREQLLQGGAPQTSIFSLQMHRPSPPQGACARHSRVARNGTSYIACRATTGQASHVGNSSIQIDHVEGYTDLEWPIDARNRRNVLCACFSHAQTRPEITPYPKSAHNGTSNRARNSGCATDRSPIKMRNISIKT